MISIKNVIITGLILLFITSQIKGCWQKDLSRPIVIKAITRIDTCLCKYDIQGQSGEWAKRTSGALYFIDSCTKYMEGDTIIFSSKKLK